MIEDSGLDDGNEGTDMRTTVTIDDVLFRRAMEYADPGMKNADIIREALKVFVRVQAGKRLAALGGSAPGMIAVHRRRPASVVRRQDGTEPRTQR